MKNLILIITTLIFSITLFGQDPVNDVFNQYAGKEGFTTVNITGELFKMLVKMKADSTHCKNLSTRIDEVKILAQEDGTKSDVNFHDLIYNKLNKKDFKELLTVKESDENVNILAKESNGRIREFLLIVSGKENVLISIKGDILLSELDDLSDSIDLKGFEMLKMLEANNKM